uniref:Gamma-1-syntrophin n=1 Tax=Geotrypetes seraphini TaxID=260995 RepID=A0A6P8Q1J9_GEOSA|nr:gamma-1-syntrophin isoform X1 [Geotrypetes seraphini]XP_033790089.1 gamma-1-syntrophin isoform X1 [Geotrypetes seraphini]XP_033790091.1 gamma-1-syntrophin isoform X1 [Geotrypetes seraphini]XP_033790092.1 gamma-1-syntrophin isoform X1 [Geotrypetes seraphini]XP_033790093.1 gamma-1-syntrophin isoform X1 [Geotrypetes seraphini]XP_033790094.1 gamma-1-syntrophin isoform X1 [Geotrypetes seraphini]XP_033790095.1 gamma-1-syntrophin isoform X1 [Geotrypetes seraphini]XP_033790096.1 gamma-1-syntrophi
MDFRTSCEETKTGICLLQDGNEEPFKVRLHLARDILMIQEQDVICVSGEPFYSGERTVIIRRQTVGGFGLSIKGGAEHNIPVVISKISKEQRAELSGLLFIGDAILQINGINVRKCRHEEVVQVLRNAGEEVTLTVSFLKRAPAFLKLPLNEDCACVPSDQSSGTSSPLCDSGLHLNYHPNNTDTLSCSSWPASPGLRWEKRWCDLRLIPLLHSRLSQYQPGTDLCRQNSFQVVAVDGVCSGIIQCLTSEECVDWLQAVATNVSNLTKHNIKKINRNFPVNQQIVYMGWIEEREQDPLQDRMYTPKFLALRGSSLFKFLAPPVTTWDWTRAEKTFTVYEIMCKIFKDSDLLDHRKHCFGVQSESGEDVYCSVELECELSQWEKAFQTATFLEVERIQCKTYACVVESHLMGLTIDFGMGFVCFDAVTKAVLWRYKFSQLKGSSDDGKSKIKFLFQNPETKQIEAKELEFSNLFAVLHCIHSFFAAKVACLDPLYVGSQATAAPTATVSASTTAAASTVGAGKIKYSI